MLPAGEDRGSETGWSKEYVEHLRTVHFTLLTISVGFILFAFVYQAEKGQVDELIGQVEGILKLRESIKHGLPCEENRPQGTRGPSFKFGEPSCSGFTIVPQNSDNMSVNVNFPIEFPDLKSIPSASNPLTDEWLSLNTLDDFKHLWTWAGGFQEVIIGGSPQCSAKLSTAGGFFKLRIIEWRQTGNGQQLSNLKWETHEDKDNIILIGTNDNLAGSIDLSCPREPGRRYRDFLVARLQAENKPFDEAFPGLDRILAKAEPSPRLLSDLRGDLWKDRSSAPPDHFEAVGLKLPAGIVSRFGVWVVLILQWYLFLHIHEIQGGFPASASGWLVAWIGVHQKYPAKLTFFASVVLLPPTAEALLIWRAVRVGDLSSTALFLSELVVIAASFVMGIYTISLIPIRSVDHRVVLND